jgi:hypothetical protein
VARHRHDPEIRLDAVAAVRRLRRRTQVRGGPPAGRGVGRVPQRAVPQGLPKPNQCPAFGKSCTPRTRWAPRWSPARAPAPRTTSSGGWRRRPVSGRRGRSEATWDRQCRTRRTGSARPLRETKRIALGHGGGILSEELIENLFLPAFGPSGGRPATCAAGRRCRPDRADYRLLCGEPAVLPGRQYGDLAVNGTINDLACSGRSRWRSPAASSSRRAGTRGARHRCADHKAAPTPGSASSPATPRWSERRRRWAREHRGGRGARRGIGPSRPARAITSSSGCRRRARGGHHERAGGDRLRHHRHH